MAQTAVMIDREFLKHDPGAGHPERPDRIKVLLDLAADLGGAGIQLMVPQAPERIHLERFHGAEYVATIAATSEQNAYALDGDTITCRDSFAVALLAVGGWLGLIDAIAAGQCRNGFALVRPPGHHALRQRAMGFCLFNTMAIGAEYVKSRHAAERVLIVDWDVHHGNGTQDAFYDDPSVMFISTHQFPFYPGSGAIAETGVGPGQGFTLNIPLPAGCGDDEYVHVFRELIIPAAQRFQPDWLLVSAGFDPHRRDPLGGMNVSEAGFAAMAQMLRSIAETHCDGRIVFLLEGGYDLIGLRDSVGAVLQRMQVAQNNPREILAPGLNRIEPLIRRIQQVHEQYQ